MWLSRVRFGRCEVKDMEQDVSRWLFWIFFMVIFALFLFLRQKRGKRENRFKKMLKGWNLQSPLCFSDFLTLKAWLKLTIKREEGKITISPFPYLFFGIALVLLFFVEILNCEIASKLPGIYVCR